MRLLSLFMLFSISGYGYSEKEIYGQIRDNYEGINKDYAKYLSRELFKACKDYQVPCQIYTAILMQESSYRPRIANRTCGMDEKTMDKVNCVYRDIGISQINYKTAERYNFDIVRLYDDVRYSIRSGAKVLSDMKKMFIEKEPKTWYSRFNCGTGGSTKRYSCVKYLKLVRRWL